MGMSEFYEPVGERDAIAAIHRALELGMTLLDTSDMYGRGENERLVGRALRGRRERAVLATKAGIVRSDDPASRGIDNRPEYLRAACDASLARLGVEYVDVFYLHRADPDVPIEETVGAMAELVARRQGASSRLVRGRRRHAAPRRGGRADRGACRAQYLAVHARRRDATACSSAARELRRSRSSRYAPLGRGLLTGAVRSTRAHRGSDDLRRRVPRFDREQLRAQPRATWTSHSSRSTGRALR